MLLQDYISPIYYYSYNLEDLPNNKILLSSHFLLAPLLPLLWGLPDHFLACMVPYRILLEMQLNVHNKMEELQGTKFFLSDLENFETYNDIVLYLSSWYTIWIVLVLVFNAAITHPHCSIYSLYKWEYMYELCHLMVVLPKDIEACRVYS